MAKTVNRERWNRTGSEMADMFGVSAVTLSGWVKDGAPKIARDQYDERAFVPWVLDQYRRKDTATLAEEQARLTKNKADLAEIELAEKRGEVVKVSDVDADWERKASVIRARFLALASITQDVVAAPNLQESQKVIEDAVWNILTELSGGGPSQDAVSDTPATIDRKRVGRQKPSAKPRVKRGTGTVEHVKG